MDVVILKLHEHKKKVERYNGLNAKKENRLRQPTIYFR